MSLLQMCIFISRFKKDLIGSESRKQDTMICGFMGYELDEPVVTLSLCCIPEENLTKGFLSELFKVKTRRKTKDKAVE